MKLASVVMLRPLPPAAPLKIHSVVITKTYKQVSDDTRVSFEINGRCDREMPGHENCRHLLLKEVDRLAPTELRNLPIRTPLQHALVLLSTRGAYGEATNPFLHRLLKNEVVAKAITVFSRYRDRRQDLAAMIHHSDLVEAMTTRYKRCVPARRTVPPREGSIRRYLVSHTMPRDGTRRHRAIQKPLRESGRYIGARPHSRALSRQSKGEDQRGNCG